MEKINPYTDDDENVEYAVPPVGSSPVKHSPISPRKEYNQEIIRSQIKTKTPEVIKEII